jgi:hypothetical protein
MGEGFWDGLEEGAEEAGKRWQAARNQVVSDAENAYQRGRQIYADAIQAGRDVVARTPQEVRALGAANTGLRAANAGVRAAANAASLGATDNLEAGTEALFGLGGPGGFQDRYDHQLALQHQADAQAAQEFPELYKWSGRAGAVAGILAADGAPVAGGLAKLIPGGEDALAAIQGAKRAGFIPEGLGTMGAVGGGAVGGVTQLAGDALQGRQTSAQDFLGAVGGGALGGWSAMHGGPVLGAAIGGGATSAFQGGDADDIMNSADASAYGGRILGTAGEQISNGLPKEMKGALGEGLSFAKSWARGETIPFKGTQSSEVGLNLPSASAGNAGPQQRVYLDDGERYTRADWLTNWGRAIEAKFGSNADLTTNQKLAAYQFGPLYQPDHWLPSDVGDFSGGWLGSTFGQDHSIDDPNS